MPPDLQGPLAGISDQTLPVASFPYGTQVCEVEADPETGEVEIVGYAAVNDVGRAINPLILPATPERVWRAIQASRIS